jgi:8-oxo-dGTP pyrophosphatase MutT (NUDIX family)
VSTHPLPSWLLPVREALDSITGHDLTRFVPPPDSGARSSAVLMLFGEGVDGPDLLLTERAHHMRSHPGQVSFPGGTMDPGDASVVATALREAEEEVGVDPAGVQVLGQLPELWLPPSNFAVTPVIAWWREESPVSVVDPDEVHAVLRVPIEELLDPTHRIHVRHPSGWLGPAFLIGDDKDLILWGFTAGVIARLFDFIGMTRPWEDDAEVRDLPDHMLVVPDEATDRMRKAEDMLREDLT